MNRDRSVCVERGRKPFYDVQLAAERKCCVIVLSFLKYLCSGGVIFFHIKISLAATRISWLL